MAPNERYAQYQPRPASQPESHSMLEEAYEGTQEIVRENPATTALVTLGVGFGLGLLLSTMLMPRRKSWYEDYIPDMSSRFQASQWTPRGGWSDAISRMIPDSLSRHAPRSWF